MGLQKTEHSDNISLKYYQLTGSLYFDWPENISRSLDDGCFAGGDLETSRCPCGGKCLGFAAL